MLATNYSLAGQN